jgi:hypothetical protein
MSKPKRGPEPVPDPKLWEPNDIITRAAAVALLADRIYKKTQKRSARQAARGLLRRHIKDGKLLEVSPRMLLVGNLGVWARAYLLGSLDDVPSFSIARAEMRVIGYARPFVGSPGKDPPLPKTVPACHALIRSLRNRHAALALKLADEQQAARELEGDALRWRAQIKRKYIRDKGDIRAHSMADRPVFSERASYFLARFAGFFFGFTWGSGGRASIARSKSSVRRIAWSRGSKSDDSVSGFCGFVMGAA